MNSRYVQFDTPCCTASYLPLPKCGCSSVLSQIGERHGMPTRGKNWKRNIGDALNVDRPTGFSFTFIRDPIERLHSAWWNKTRLRNGTPDMANHLMRIWKGYDFKPGMSFSAFVRIVLETPLREAEDHFRPYSAIMQRAGWPSFIGDLGSQKDWQRVTEQTGINRVRRNHESSRPAVKLSEKLRASLLKYYADDYKLWELVHGGNHGTN